MERRGRKNTLFCVQMLTMKMKCTSKTELRRTTYVGGDGNKIRSRRKKKKRKEKKSVCGEEKCVKGGLKLIRDSYNHGIRVENKMYRSLNEKAERRSI